MGLAVEIDPEANQKRHASMIKRSSYSQETFSLSNVGYDTLKYEYHYLLLLAMDKEKKTREGKKRKEE